MKQPNQSDHIDYQIMRARTRLSNQGASPVAIQLLVDLLEAPVPVTKTSSRLYTESKACNPDCKLGYYLAIDYQEGLGISGDPIESLEMKKGIFDIDCAFPDCAGGRKKARETIHWRYDSFDECWRKVVPLPGIVPLDTDEIMYIHADGTRSFYRWDNERWNRVQP